MLMVMHTQVTHGEAFVFSNPEWMIFEHDVLLWFPQEVKQFTLAQYSCRFLWTGGECRVPGTMAFWAMHRVPPPPSHIHP